MSLKLTPITLGPDKLKELVGWACEKFRHSVTSRQTQIDGNYRRWLDNYAGKPLESVRTTPFYKASNFVPQLIRMHTDILSAQLVGLMFGTKPFWRPRTFVDSVPNDVVLAVGSWLDNLCQFDIEFFEPIDLGIFLTVKTGLHVIKTTWASETHERAGGGGEVKTVTREGLCIDNLPFDDMYPFPVTAQTFKACSAIFQRLRLSKQNVEYRKHTKQWNEEACDMLLKQNTSQPQPVGSQVQAQTAGISLTPDVTFPYSAVECWTTYELSPGKLSDIVLTFDPFNPTDKGALRLVYNFHADDLDPFVDLRIMPREGLIVGDCVPNILEQAQEEQAQIHNSRRDANTIGNVPGWKKKKYADVGGSPSTNWYPGKVFELDSMDDLEPLTVNANYQSLVEEESFLLELANAYTGVSSPKQGFGAGTVGKKGTYSSMGTMALLSTGSKRDDIYLQRLRSPFHKLGRLLFTSYRDFRRDGKEWSMYGQQTGELVKKAFELSEPDGLKGVFFGIGASDAGANKEVDRQNLLLMSNTMAAYYKEIMALAPQIASMPDGSPAKELSLQVLDGARDLANRILAAFDVWDRKKIIPDVRQLFGGGAANPEQPKPLEQAGVPSADEPVSSDQLQSMASTIAQVQGASANATPSNGSGPGRT